ncbi:MAG: hypothetical protein SCK57_09685 [Bacillota bacterium]|nr:hypothetical protein [Bacillota bacterium]MDW7677919.1 hypothetical protein [Bacillota bacterium]
MKKSLILPLVVLLLMVLSTGTVFAAVNGVEAKADERNPAFEVQGMGEMGGMVVNENNKDLHFSIMHGHIMIPGNGGEKAQADVFQSGGMGDMSMTHLAPTGRVKQFHQGGH